MSVATVASRMGSWERGETRARTRGEGRTRRTVPCDLLQLLQRPPGAAAWANLCRRITWIPSARTPRRACGRLSTRRCEGTSFPRRCVHPHPSSARVSRPTTLPRAVCASCARLRASLLRLTRRLIRASSGSYGSVSVRPRRPFLGSHPTGPPSVLDACGRFAKMRGERRTHPRIHRPMPAEDVRGAASAGRVSDATLLRGIAVSFSKQGTCGVEEGRGQVKPRMDAIATNVGATCIDRTFVADLEPFQRTKGGSEEGRDARRTLRKEVGKERDRNGARRRKNGSQRRRANRSERWASHGRELVQKGSNWNESELQRESNCSEERSLV